MSSAGLARVLLVSGGISLFPLLHNVTAGANPISIKRGIDKTCEYLVRLAAADVPLSTVLLKVRHGAHLQTSSLPEGQ